MRKSSQFFAFDLQSDEKDINSRLFQFSLEEGVKN